MDLQALHGKQLLAAVVFVAATVVLAVQLITPTPVVVSVGEGGTEVAELGGYFQYRDVAVITVSAVLLGSSGTYLVTTDWSGRDAKSPAIDRRPPDSAGGAVRTDGNDGLAPSGDLLDARREESEETAERLAKNEREIYETILDEDGVMAQSDIVDATDLSKATVSRTLDSLETKNLVERRRRGMGNMVLLL
ncbi:transcriptional regulator [Halorubrum sp. Ib24]|uniref:helix-turn-helix transcriptional regulator n=1 Tax=Halorubrum sp. Ib24 TaxID=1383850 RepID=UPI000B987239|nr:MarR family transcriptional regulator [Halorubrum sp. Ib24]OYR41685.1 transcriptional regulator [Halorubrum sp. Ib24]